MSDGNLLLEQEKMKSKNILLEVLLTITGFITAIYPTRQGQIDSISVLIVLCIFAFIFLDLFLIAISMSDICIFEKFQSSIEIIYYLLSISFAILLPAYLVSSIIMPILAENINIQFTVMSIEIYNININSIIVPIAKGLIFSYVFLITVVLLGTLSSEFTYSFASLSDVYKWIGAGIFLLSLICSIIPILSPIRIIVIILILLVFSVVKPCYSFGIICLTVIIAVVISWLLTIEPSTLHHFVVSNVTVALNNTSLT